LFYFITFQGDIVKELGKARLEIDNVKRQMLQQEIAFNIQQTDALTRLVTAVGGMYGVYIRGQSLGFKFRKILKLML
jgi:hypothetical protein